MKKLKIVLLTIDKAGQILIERLVGILPKEISLELVVTRETRSYDFEGNPVVNACKKTGIKYLQPDFKESAYIEIIKNIQPDIIIISNFHRIVKKELIEIPKIGTFNLHSSLLPQLRGGTSIIWALKNGLKKTGVTLHYVTEGIDDGDIIKQKEVNIDFWDTQGSLYDKITIAKFEILYSFLSEILEGKNIKGIPQNHKDATYLPKRKDSDGLIDLNCTMLQIYNHIRSFDPWTGAYIKVNNTNIRLRNVIPVKKKLTPKVDDNYLILSKKCKSGIQSLIVQAISDKIEYPSIYDRNLADSVFNFWITYIEKHE